MATPNSYSAISTLLSPPISPNSETFIVQYEVRATRNLTCSGAYIKLFSQPDFDPSQLSNETRHAFMFGPDVCADKNRLAFYFYHTDPTTGRSVEKGLVGTTRVPKDSLNHLYTLVLRQNGSLCVYIDGEIAQSMLFNNSFVPPIVPPLRIPDPSFSKPADWDDREFVDDDSIPRPVFEDKFAIPDPAKFTPPPGWLIDEPPFIPDPSVERPADWDDDLFGEWKHPAIPNPKCKSAPGCGPYSAPLIANPRHQDNYVHPRIKNAKYRGAWQAPVIDTPDYFYDPEPYMRWPNITGIGFELWTVDGEIGFNNVLLANDEEAVMNWNEENFRARVARQILPSVTPAAAYSEPGIKKSHSPLVLIAAAIGQIAAAWSEMYAEAEGTTLILTVGVLLLPFFIAWFCSRRRRRGSEEEEVNE
jgi:calnexin